MNNIVYQVALVIGSITLLSVCFVYVKHQIIQLGGTVLSGFAVILIGMSVWKSIDISVDENGFKAKLEQALKVAKAAKEEVAEVKEISLNNSKAALALRDSVNAFKAQETLRNMGFYKGAVDGHLGVVTKSSILDFQKLKNIPMTGTLDFKTIKELKIEPVHNFPQLEKNLIKSSREAFVPASQLKR